MKKYEKPIILANSDLSEGVYTASGAAGNGPKCDSKHMKGVFKAPDYTNTTSNIGRYGCNGCPAFRHNGCGLQSDYVDSNYASSYDADNGNRMPEWEKKGWDPNKINY